MSYLTYTGEEVNSFDLSGHISTFVQYKVSHYFDIYLNAKVLHPLFPEHGPYEDCFIVRTVSDDLPIMLFILTL